MKKHLLISLLALLSYSGIAQVTFEKSIWVNDYSMFLYSVKQTADRGYIIINADISLIKTDSNGDTLWVKVYSGGCNIKTNSIIQTADGGYFITGTTDSSGAGGEDVYVIKTDSSGVPQWSKTIGGAANDIGNAGVQTADGGYIVTGSTMSFGTGNGDMYLIKLNNTGDTLWTKTYGIANETSGTAVEQTTDGGYIIAGTVAGTVNYSPHIILLKTNSLGDTLWSKYYFVTDSIINSNDFYLDYSSSVQQTTDGGYIISGTTDSSVQGGNAIFFKTDSLGNVIWSKEESYEGTYGYGAQQTYDGGYILGAVFPIGLFQSFISLFKVDSNGDSLWAKTWQESFGDAVWYYPTPSFVQQTTDSGFVFVASGFNTQGNFFKTDANGNTSCSNNNTTYRLDTISLHVANFPKSISSGGIVTTPVTTVGRPGATYNTFCTTGIATIQNEETISLYPNPTTSSFTISTTAGKIKEVKMFDVLGSLVISHLSLGSAQETIDMSGVSKGIYFVQIQTDGSASSPTGNLVNRKVVIE